METLVVQLPRGGLGFGVLGPLLHVRGFFISILEKFYMYINNRKVRVD